MGTQKKKKKNVPLLVSILTPGQPVQALAL